MTHLQGLCICHGKTKPVALEYNLLVMTGPPSSIGGHGVQFLCK